MQKCNLIDFCIKFISFQALKASIYSDPVKKIETEKAYKRVTPLINHQKADTVKVQCLYTQKMLCN